MKQKKIFSIYWLATFLWAGVIFYLSHLPAEELPGWQIPYLDKVIHAAEFGILAWLSFKSFRAIWPAFLFAFLYALSDEFHQFFVPGRFPDIYDLLADTSGIFLVLLFVKKIDKPSF